MALYLKLGALPSSGVEEYHFILEGKQKIILTTLPIQ